MHFLPEPSPRRATILKTAPFSSRVCRPASQADASPVVNEQLLERSHESGNNRRDLIFGAEARRIRPSSVLLARPLADSRTERKIPVVLGAPPPQWASRRGVTGHRGGERGLFTLRVTVVLNSFRLLWGFYGVGVPCVPGLDSSPVSVQGQVQLLLLRVCSPGQEQQQQHLFKLVGNAASQAPL